MSALRSPRAAGRGPGESSRGFCGPRITRRAGPRQGRDEPDAPPPRREGAGGRGEGRGRTGHRPDRSLIALLGLLDQLLDPLAALVPDARVELGAALGLDPLAALAADLLVELVASLPGHGVSALLSDVAEE